MKAAFIFRGRTAALEVILLTGQAPVADPGAGEDRIDWPAFMRQHDMTFDPLPGAWSEAPHFGNAMVGSMLYRADDTIRLQVFRADVHDHRDDTGDLYPNGLWYESPCIESTLAAANIIQDMLIQSWIDPAEEEPGPIRIFPAVPSPWKDVEFRDLRAEGAFLVSAKRSAGETRWVRIKSLAGEPCRVRPGMNGEIRIKGGREHELKPVSPGIYPALFMNIVAPEKNVEMEGHDPIFSNRDRVPHFPTGVNSIKKFTNNAGYEIDLKKGEDIMLYTGTGPSLRPAAGPGR